MMNYYPQNQMPMQSYNPYSQMQQQAQSQNLIRVNGIDGAKAYQMSANSTVALFDCNEDLMYVKSTDGAGFPMIRTFRFEEVNNSEPKQDMSANYISREEFEKFKEEVMNNGKFTIQKQQHNS